MIVTRRKSSALLFWVGLLLLVVTFFVSGVTGRRVANRPGKKNSRGRRRLQDGQLDFEEDEEEDPSNNRIGQVDSQVGAGFLDKTLFGNTKSETINEKATEVQEEYDFFGDPLFDPDWRKGGNTFFEVCTDICAQILEKASPNFFATLSHSRRDGHLYARRDIYPVICRESRTVKGWPYMRGTVDLNIAEELWKLDLIKLPPSTLSTLGYGICGCLYDCDYQKSLKQCYHKCFGEKYTSNYTTEWREWARKDSKPSVFGYLRFQGITPEPTPPPINELEEDIHYADPQDDHLRDWCQSTPSPGSGATGCLDDDNPNCVDACVCAFRCQPANHTSLDREWIRQTGKYSEAYGALIPAEDMWDTNNDECFEECTSVYNDYTVLDYVHARAVRLSDCVYSNKGCEVVENKDWNTAWSSIKCYNNTDYDPTAERNGTNYEVLQQRICVEEPCLCLDTTNRATIFPLSRSTAVTSNPPTASPSPTTDAVATMSGTNDILARATVTLDPRYQWDTQAVANNVIHGDHNHEDFLSYPSTRVGHCLFRTQFAPWVQIDLGAPKLVYGITIWHYWGDQRQYCSQGLKVSTDGETWHKVFDIGHDWGQKERPEGNHYSFEPQTARYLRHYSGPSNLNNVVHFLGIKVDGVEISNTNSLVADVGTMVMEKIEKECSAPAVRRRLGADCPGEGMKVQCSLGHEVSFVSDDLKTLFVEEGARKINTGFSYDIMGACSDLVDVSITVLSNEVDEKQSAFLTKTIQTGGKEVPRIYVAPRRCREDTEGEHACGCATDIICEPSPSGKRFYDIEVRATDEASGETAKDTCRVIVIPHPTQGRELRGGNFDPLSKEEHHQLVQASPTRTVVGSISLRVSV